MSIEAKKESRVVKVSEGVYVLKPRTPEEAQQKPQQWTTLCQSPLHKGDREVFVFAVKAPRWKCCLECFKREQAQVLPPAVAAIWAQACAPVEAR
jgi:hypothetical protein